MTHRERLNNIKDTIAGTLKENQVGKFTIYLFGSRAKGMERPDSDYDIMVVAQRDFDGKERFNLLRKIRNKIKHLGLAIDVVLKSANEYNTGRNRVGTLISSIQNEIQVENFDAGSDVQRDDYDMLIATDAISEGYNLHRAGAIFNYDIPYNPTRVIQRVGRRSVVSLEKGKKAAVEKIRVMMDNLPQKKDYLEKLLHVMKDLDGLPDHMARVIRSVSFNRLDIDFPGIEQAIPGTYLDDIIEKARRVEEGEEYIIFSEEFHGDSEAK